MNFVWVPRDLHLEENFCDFQFIISCEFGPHQVKLWYHIISSMKMENEMKWISVHWHFSSKTCSQKYSAWALEDLTLSCFCSVAFLSDERYKSSEPDCYTLVISLLNNILVWFMFKGLFIWMWTGPVRWTSSPRWDDFYPTFIWNLLSWFNQKVR